MVSDGCWNPKCKYSFKRSDDKTSMQKLIFIRVVLAVSIFLQLVIPKTCLDFGSVQLSVFFFGKAALSFFVLHRDELQALSQIGF